MSAAPPEPDQAPLDLGDPSQPTVMVVDDSPENLHLLGQLLMADYRVRAVNSGQRALHGVRVAPVPDLILLDVMMPDMDGYEVLRRLREDPQTRAIPVIFVTAMDAEESEELGFSLGAVDYVTKPIRPAILAARVRAQIELKRMRDWLRDQNAYLEHEVGRRVAENLAMQAERRRVEDRLNHLRQLILDSTDDGIFGVDAAGCVNFANRSAAVLLGYAPEELPGLDARSLFVGPGEASGMMPPELSPLHASLTVGTLMRGREVLLRERSGAHLTLEVSSAPIVDGGRIAGAVVTLKDHRERKRYLAELERRTNYDDLTGLPNRNLLNDRLQHAIEQARRNAGQAAVLSFNIDRFKEINDALGRDAGDIVLRTVACRLRERLRKMDTLARLDGDEFVLVAELERAELAADLARPLMRALGQPIVLDGREFLVTCSVGIATFPKDGDDAVALLRNATAAMYRAKSRGGEQLQFYSIDMNLRAIDRLDLETGLRKAIDQGQLLVHYQPQVNLRSGEIIGAEALVRWQHPEKGLLLPGTFISLAEETGLIVPLGDWVLRTACRQNKRWQEAGLTPIPVAVNLSARQFVAQDVVTLAGDVLRETGLDPRYLELELTESAIMADADAFIRATECLKGLSIALSIDDFGTGFSSLSYLRRLSVDRLKIDQSFVRDVAHDPDSASIANAIISLAHNLKLLAIAEGVETEAQMAFLRARGCDEIQGFYFSRPVPPAEFEKLLRERRRLELPGPTAAADQTLLLVDDEPGILASLKRLLRREGYRILTAESALDGLDLLAGHEVGVVISDARMPHIEGAEFLSRVRSMYPDAIRIMLSGYTDLKAVTSAVNRGELFRFLTKPWDDAELIEVVREAFVAYRQRKSPQVPKP